MKQIEIAISDIKQNTCMGHVVRFMAKIDLKVEHNNIICNECVLEANSNNSEVKELAEEAKKAILEGIKRSLVPHGYGADVSICNLLIHPAYFRLAPFVVLTESHVNEEINKLSVNNSSGVGPPNRRSHTS